MAKAYFALGVFQRASEDNLAAITAYEAGVAIDDKLVAAAPDDPTLADQEATLLQELGGALIDQKDLEGASAALHHCLTLRETLVKRDAENSSWAANLSFTHYYLGDLLISRKLGAEAVAELLTARQMQDALIAKHPTDGNLVDTRARLLDSLGDAYLLVHDDDRALSTYRASIVDYQKSLATDPLTASKVLLGIAWSKVAVRDKLRGDLAEAGKDAAEGIAILQAVIAADASDPDNSIELARLFALSASVPRDPAEARALADKAVEAARSVVHDDKGTPKQKAYLAEVVALRASLGR